MNKNTIKLSDHFTIGRLVRYSLPSIVMMVFTSIYSVVDGFFVSNFAGKTAFAAVNLVMPYLMILSCCGFMLGTGSSALVGKILGEGDKDRANRVFSLVVYFSAVLGIVLAALGLLLLKPFVLMMGAEGQLLHDGVVYGTIFIIAMPFYIIQYEFQCLFSTAEKPGLGLFVTVGAGITNIVLDAVLVGIMKMGIVGAAVATGLSQFVGSIIPLVYFAMPNSSLLRLTRCRIDLRAIVKVCTNGSSELMSNISVSVVSVLYNLQLMKFAGENGVAAYGTLMYVSMIFQAIFIGYNVGVAPVVSYHFGAGNRGEMKSLLRKSAAVIGVFSVCMFGLSQLLARPLSELYAGYDRELFAITLNAFTIFSFTFLLCGFSMFGSSFFTALNEGLTSAAISFLRTLVFQCAAVLIFPIFFGLNGIWYAGIASEIMSLCVTLAFLIGKRKRFGYM